MGALLLAAGAKGKRFALPNSRVMIHQPLGRLPGPGVGHRHPRQARSCSLRERLNEILAKHTGQPVEADRAGHRARQFHDRRAGA